MRLGFDATSLLDTRTGVGTMAAEVLARLAGRDDLDVVAFAVTWRGRGRLAAAVPRGVATRARPVPARAARRLWRRVGIPPVEWLAGPVDVVHGPNFVVPPARRAARLVTVHDLTFMRFPDLVRPDVARLETLVRQAIDSGAHVHTVSNFVAGEVIEAFGAPPERVHVIPNGVDAVAGGTPERGHGRAGGARYVLAVGTVEPRKDFPLLVRAFDTVADADAGLRLVIAGPDGWGVAALTDAIRAALHRDRIVRIGWLGPDEHADLLAGAAVLAYPSRYEGFGLPPLEAMSVGLPVVTTRAGAIPEIVGDAAVLVDPGDDEAFAGALERAINDEDLRRSLAAKGHERAARYRWDDTADALVALYGRLAAGH